MSNRLHTVALTAGSNVPSAHFRVGQNVEVLAELGIDIDWRPAAVSKYPPSSSWARPFWLAGAVSARIPSVLASRSADFTIMNRELVSTLKTLESWVGHPCALDVDDAIWLTQRFGSIAKIANMVDTVFAGNQFVADWFSDYCNDIVIVPTAVDVNRFIPDRSHKKEQFTVGWSGTSGNLSTLEVIWPALTIVAQRYDELVVRIVSNEPPRVPGVLRDRVEFIPWTRENEVRTIQEMDVGLMPLVDNDWSRGKCSYKMLLYMACGVPVVVSPVGMNNDVLSLGEVGFGPRTKDEWVDAISSFASDAGLCHRYGDVGRKTVVSHYSVRVVAEILSCAIRRVVEGT